MKGFRSTGIFFAVAAALAGYTFYEYRKAAEDNEIAQGDHRLFRMVRDDIEIIELKSKDSQIVIEKTGEGWRLNKPVEDQADASAVEGFIYTLLTQKGKDFRSKDDGAINWSQFGLEPITRQVDIKGKGKAESLSVSSTHAFDGSFYVRQGENLWLGDRGLAQLVDREAKSFRSRRIYRGPNEVTELKVFDGAKEFTVKKAADKDKNVWTLQPEPGFAIDSAKVTVWAQKVEGLQAQDIVSDKLSEDDRTQYLLKKPSYNVTLKDETLTFGQNRDGEVFVITSARPVVYKVTANTLDAIRVPVNYFRDGRAPFTFNLERLREIEWLSAKGNMVLQKKDDNWVVASGAVKGEVDKDKLTDWVQKVQSLEAREFLKAAGPGLPASPQIIFKGEGGQVLLSLTWGGDFKSAQDFNRGLKLQYVKVSGQKEILAVEKEKLDPLVDSAILKEKPAEKPESK